LRKRSAKEREFRYPPHASQRSNTAQLKDVFDRSKRAEILADAFSVDRAQTVGKRLLLFDDLFRSGATAGTLARLLSRPGGRFTVYFC
jgi:predicted amidophosphoribosyltransferase